MKLLEKLCKELGVEVGEIWQGNDGFKYCILIDGRLERFEGKDFEDFKDDIGRVLTGELKPVWKPKEGETCYIPYICGEEVDRFEWFTWRDEPQHEWYLKNNLLFKTKKEAIEATNKMLEAIKE